MEWSESRLKKYSVYVKAWFLWFCCIQAIWISILKRCCAIETVIKSISQTSSSPLVRQFESNLFPLLTWHVSSVTWCSPLGNAVAGGWPCGTWLSRMHEKLNLLRVDKSLLSVSSHFFLYVLFPVLCLQLFIIPTSTQRLNICLSEKSYEKKKTHQKNSWLWQTLDFFISPTFILIKFPACRLINTCSWQKRRQEKIKKDHFLIGHIKHRIMCKLLISWPFITVRVSPTWDIISCSTTQ